MSHRPSLRELETLLESWISTPSGRRSFLASVPLLLTACTAKQKTRYREGDNQGQTTQMTYDDERALTSEALPELRKAYPPLRNSEIQDYISRIGHNIAKANRLEGNPYSYSFTAVSTPMVNAFALPAGTIFVTVPLIAMADTEAELAGVIGHEIGHVKARHAAERMEQQRRDRKKNLWMNLGGAILGGAAGFGLGKALCAPKDRECLAKAAAIGAAAGAGSTLLIQQFSYMANSREDEMEADRIGFRTAVAAGYSKNHVGDFFEKLQKMEESRQKSGTPFLKSVTDAMSTHPPSLERVQQMKKMSAETSQKGGEVSSKDFEKIQRWAKMWTQENSKG